MKQFNQMNDQEYRSFPAISNSDLNAYSNVLFPGSYVITAPKQALVFGSVFHQAVLEPHKTADDSLLSVEEWNTLDQMYMSFMSDPELKMALFNAETEVARFWNMAIPVIRSKNMWDVSGETVIVPCKCKVDAIISPEHYLDVKTTSCKTQADFEQTILEYHYDRQAAFYMMSHKDVWYFEFVGVQKQAPYGLVKVILHRDSDVVKKGRQEVNMLLKAVAKELAKKDGWRPKSWQHHKQA